MNSNRKFIFIAGIIALMLIVVWLFNGSGSEEEQARTYVSDNWEKRFQPFDKDPLGLYLFNTLAQSHINSSKDVYDVKSWDQLDSLMHSGKRQKTFMFIGNIFGVDNKEMDSIMTSVSKGSEFFFSYNKVTSNILKNFFVEYANNNLAYEERFEYSKSVDVIANKLKCNMLNIFQNDTIACEWRAFGDIETVGSYKSLSSFLGMDNFIEIKIGKGKVFLHTNPSMFYNYQVKRKSGYAYTEFVLSKIPKDQDILLLELGRLSDDYGKYNDGGDGDGPEDKRDDSALRVLFENPTLLTALLLSILGLILFVVFRSKRKRPIVPYKGKKKDMTLAFADTITSIYFSKRNPFGLLQVQRKNFYATIHRHFFVDLSRREGDKELIRLAEKSNKPLGEIRAIVQRLEVKDSNSVNEQDVIEIAHQQRAFYREVGIIPELIEERLERQTKVFKRGLLLPVFLILTSLFSIILGVYYLVISNGIGIALWPVGIVLFVLGVIRLSKPFMKIDPLKITYYTSLGAKKIFKQEDLIGTEMKASGVVLKFTDNRTLIIKYWDLSRFDRADFERFIAKLHTLEL